MKTTIIRTALLLLCTVAFTGCFEEDENRFRPGSAQPVAPEPPATTDTPDYTRLTAANHPRLLMNAAEFDALKEKVASNSDATLTLLHNTVVGLANSKGLATAKLTYKLDASNKRILDVSRDALLRIFSCAYAYRMTGDAKYLTHAEEDINTVCAFSDWNAKRHFLDVGEMATAVALGYDWLYNDLQDATRAKAEKALRDYAFKPANEKTWNLNFYEATNNWNQVCNGGLVCAALAIYETCATDAKAIIEKSLESNVAPLETMYSPDGNYPEGYGYWCYGTLYEALMLAAMESATGSDNKLSATPGFSATAEYMLYMVGMSSRCFNYSDCAPSTVPALATWYFADKFGHPDWLYNELRMLQNGEYANASENRLLPMVMAFANRMTLGSVKAPEKKLWKGYGENPVVLIHIDWSWGETDKYLGIKAGTAGASHGHMDAGGFVYDAYGVHWSVDLGLQSYTTLESAMSALGGNLWDMNQSSMRWDVFRLNNKNHSTITVNDANHLVKGSATLKSVIESDTELGAMVDMTDVVSDQAASAQRTIKLVQDKDLVVIDAIKARPDKAAKVRWTMVTTAVPTVESNRIVLVNGGKTMYLTAVGDGAKVSYQTWSSDPAEYDTPVKDIDAKNPNIYLVGFEATITSNQSATFTTTLTPKE